MKYSIIKEFEPSEIEYIYIVKAEGYSKNHYRVEHTKPNYREVSEWFLNLKNAIDCYNDFIQSL